MSVVMWTFKDYKALVLQTTRRKVDLSTGQAKSTQNSNLFSKLYIMIGLLFIFTKLAILHGKYCQGNVTCLATQIT